MSLLTCHLSAQTTKPPKTLSCVVIAEANSENIWKSDAAACATRLSPASTYKIPHALIGLETGVVQPDTVEKWDGVRHPDQPKWNRDHTVLSAMKPSVLWFFQRMAPKIGAERAHDWLEKFEYGNRRTDGDVKMYWINGTLQVSPEEQVRFLKRFFAETLPVDVARQRMVRDAIAQPPATVENAQGVTRLQGSWPRDAKWNVKTGRTNVNRASVSWLVGRLEANGLSSIFASAVWRDDNSVDSLDAARLAVKTFIDRGLIARTPGR